MHYGELKIVIIKCDRQLSLILRYQKTEK